MPVVPLLPTSSLRDCVQRVRYETCGMPVDAVCDVLKLSILADASSIKDRERLSPRCKGIPRRHHAVAFFPPHHQHLSEPLPGYARSSQISSSEAAVQVKRSPPKKGGLERGKS